MNELWSDRWWTDITLESFCKQHKHELNLSPNTEFFLQSTLPRILNAKDIQQFQPNFNDLVHVRHPTTGIEEVTIPNFIATDCHVKLVDAGGMRNQRKKWVRACLLHFFFHTFQKIKPIDSLL